MVFDLSFFCCSGYFYHYDRGGSVSPVFGKKRKAFQKIDEQIRQDVDDALAFLEDETGKNLNEEKREEFKLLVITRLKKAERHNKEAIKKNSFEKKLIGNRQKKE